MIALSLQAGWSTPVAQNPSGWSTAAFQLIDTGNGNETYRITPYCKS